LPPGAESLDYLQLMNERSALRNDFNLVVAADLAELREMRDRAEAEPAVERFESVLTFLPAEPAASRAAVADAAALLERVAVADRNATRAELGSSLERLEAALAEAADNAFVTGLGELAGELERARATAEMLASIRLDDQADRTRQQAEQELRERTRDFLRQLREAAQTAPPTTATLPANLRDRFLTRNGDLIGYLYPTGSMYDAEFLRTFVEASREVSDGAIGFPVLFEDHSRLITEGFGTALAVGAALVVLLLMLDLRHPGHTLLALVPVVAGSTWLLGLMVLLGLDFNFANLIAVPIVLGVGIDAGVHLVHRYRLEGEDGMVTALSHTGRAILVASLTTMAGFGSLALASHRGMASLGVLLFLGVGSCLVAALVLLPNLILALGIARR